MEERALSGSQKFFTRFLGPEAAAAAEAESRAWLVLCPDCGFERSVWDTGGVRYRASGNARLRMRCPACGTTGWQKLVKGPNFPTARGPVWPLVRLVAILVLLILLLVAAILLTIFRLTGR
jgi:ribosomal protein S27E